MRRLLLILSILFIASASSFAQFGGGNLFGNAGAGGNNSSQDEVNDTTINRNRFTIKKYFNALAHKEDTLTIGWMWGGSAILPGTAQIYNKDYWKLAVFYPGIVGLAAGGCYYNVQYNKFGNKSDQTARTLFFIGAGIFYWASMADGITSYKTHKTPHPGKAALYSAIFPGLGQIYNGDYWKLPIYYGAGATAGYLWYYYGLQYTRFRDLYNQATTPDGGYTGNISTENLKYYRNQYRRYRDYSILGTVAVYVLQIIDANVFASMNDFDVSDDLTFNLTPAIITPITNYNNYTYTSSMPNAFGLSLNFTF